ncbi:hypothetical protein BHYA_0283g00070 [Botrytis hyacinthi]|uniref:Uncharacterized protein n=1 Tax=Botrytis hyacinthi TaxID=278943 RepID=A0A4Z1GCP0_9HELO|nr:hypothetical protein BHYA_0283g00070 [Botrytis hyacinthi]
MTSNKNKRSTPHKSPHKSSPHKFHKPGKPHKSPKEKVAPAKPSLPILPQKNSEGVPPILPPTRRILFPQSLKKSNSQQPFLSPHAVKIDHQKTKKHTSSSPAAKFSVDRPFKKPCLSSPSPAKRTKLIPATPERVNGRERTIPSSDDEDENEIEIGDNTPNPPSRKRKANVMADAAGSHKKAPPPKTSVAVVIPSKQQPSSSFYTIHPNSPAVQKIDITVSRLEKEELQHRLDISSQQAQKAMNEAQEWENRCKETTDVQDNLNRLLRAEIEDKERLQKQLESFREQTHGLNLEAKNWEDKWKEAASEIDVFTTQIQTLQQEILQKEHLSSQVSQLTTSLEFTHDLLSQAERTHNFETTALNQQITHLKQKQKLLISSQEKASEDLTALQKEYEKMREEIFDKDEEIRILNGEFEEERKRMRREIERWEGEVRVKDGGLQRMGVLVAGWVLKWRSLGEGMGTEMEMEKGGGVPAVEGVGICVDGVRL